MKNKLPLIAICVLLMASSLMCKAVTGQTKRESPWEPLPPTMQTAVGTRLSPQQARPSLEGGPVGSLSGKLSFPGEAIPPLRVVAIQLETASFFYIDTPQNQVTYRIENLPPGNYHVIAYFHQNGVAGAYTRMVPCGLKVGCDDHTLIDVPVKAGQDTPNIDPGDWYAPRNSFPSDPSQ